MSRKIKTATSSARKIVSGSTRVSLPRTQVTTAINSRAVALTPSSSASGPHIVDCGHNREADPGTLLPNFFRTYVLKVQYRYTLGSGILNAGLRAPGQPDSLDGLMPSNPSPACSTIPQFWPQRQRNWSWPLEGRVSTTQRERPFYLKLSFLTGATILRDCSCQI